MIAKRNNDYITLLVYYSAFHELGLSGNNHFVDKYGRDWSPVIDPETNLKCFQCKDSKVFPDNSILENRVKYV